METSPGPDAPASSFGGASPFPISWENPKDATLFWTHQRLHFPEPITPLDEWFVQSEFEAATRVAQAYEIPISGKARRLNSYAYATIVHARSGREDHEESDRRTPEQLDAAMGTLAEDWQTRWLPEIQQHLAFWARFDLGRASLPDLRAHLEESIAGRTRLWDIHFFVWFPAYTAIGRFDDLYHQLWPNTETFGAFRLLQGFPNKTLEATLGLWKLSRQALTMPDVQPVLQESAAAEVPTVLAGSPNGRRLLAALGAYLDAYGQRCDKWLPSSPSWIEDPTPVIKNLKDYVGQVDRDLPAELAGQVRERTRALADVRRRLAHRPRPLVDQVENWLKAAQAGTVLSEDHGFWIDFRGWYPIRRLFLECGRRFVAARVLERAEDVFFLTLDELRATAAAMPDLDRRALVDSRQAEMAHYRTVQPPACIGTPPVEPPPNDPVSRTLVKFFGSPPAPEDAHTIRGHAGSPGRMRGRAKVIRALRDGSKLQVGDILIAETTAPPWTPLFATAAAIVTDTGGILSHGAIVAREYGIPAVVGTGNATTVFQDDQLVEVDGDKGIVQLVTNR